MTMDIAYISETNSDQRVFFRTFLPLFGVSLVIAFGGNPWGTTGFAGTLGICAAIDAFISLVVVWTCAASRDSDQRVRDANNKWAHASNVSEYALRKLAEANEVNRLLCEELRAEIADLRPRVGVIVEPESAKPTKRARAKR